MATRNLPQPSIAVLESRIAAQHRDLQTLLHDNQRLAADHVVLSTDLTASRRELHLLSDSAARAKSERDLEVRELIDRSRRVEEDAIRVEKMREELVVVRGDVARLGREREETRERVVRLREEVGRVGEVRGEIDYFRNEIVRGRAAVEYEKKVLVENNEHSQAMEKNMVAMAREVERLRAELANAEKRAQAAAAKTGPAYAETYGNEMQYAGSTYSSAYGFNQAPRVADGGPHYAPRGPYWHPENAST